MRIALLTCVGQTSYRFTSTMFARRRSRSPWDVILDRIERRTKLWRNSTLNRCCKPIRMTSETESESASGFPLHLPVHSGSLPWSGAALVAGACLIAILVYPTSYHPPLALSILSPVNGYDTETFTERGSYSVSGTTMTWTPDGEEPPYINQISSDGREITFTQTETTAGNETLSITITFVRT